MEGEDTEDAGVDTAEGEEESGGVSGLVLLPEEALASRMDGTLACRLGSFGWYETGEEDE